VGQRPIIHIVDDDESFRTALQSLFRSVGHLTCAHGSVAEFLAAPREDAADPRTLNRDAGRLSPAPKPDPEG
jgi:FixJ family two-component response regulator